ARLLPRRGVHGDLRSMARLGNCDCGALRRRFDVSSRVSRPTDRESSRRGADLGGRGESSPPNAAESLLVSYRNPARRLLLVVAAALVSSCGASINEHLLLARHGD